MQRHRYNRRFLIAGGVAAAALAIGGTGVAIAQSGDDPKPAYTSSVTVADSAAESKAGDSALGGLAKITPDQAKAAALAAVPGTAEKVELENENGNVVFGTEVTTASGARVDVKVDAGNGAVLAQEPEDDKESADKESDSKGASETESTNEANEPATSPTP